MYHSLMKRPRTNSRLTPLLANGCFLALVSAGLMLWSGCGKIDINASGTATVRHVVTIEFGVCDSQPTDEAKMECVKSLLRTMEEAVSKKTAE